MGFNFHLLHGNSSFTFMWTSAFPEPFVEEIIFSTLTGIGSFSKWVGHGYISLLLGPNSVTFLCFCFYSAIIIWILYLGQYVWKSSDSSNLFSYLSPSLIICLSSIYLSLYPSIHSLSTISVLAAVYVCSLLHFNLNVRINFPISVGKFLEFWHEMNWLSRLLLEVFLF